MEKATPEAKLLASLILAAAKLREKSFVHGKFAESGRLEVAGHYATTIQQASERTCQDRHQPSLGLIVYLTLLYTWNDALDWANVVNDAEVT
jgi:hypothetical protein